MIKHQNIQSLPHGLKWSTMRIHRLNTYQHKNRRNREILWNYKRKSYPVWQENGSEKLEPSGETRKIIEGHEFSLHYIHACTDGSNGDVGGGSRIAIFSENNLTATLKFRLNGRCSNNQAEQMAILKALEYIQYSEAGGKSALVYRDSRITLQLLQNQKEHTHLIEQIRTKVIELEQDEWKEEFSWIKAHVRHSGNELADPLAKEAASSRTIDECYTRIPKSAV